MAKQHIDPEQAVLIHKHLRAAQSMPIHWGTFQLTHEPLMEPPRLLAEATVKHKVEAKAFRPVKIGETLLLR